MVTGAGMAAAKGEPATMRARSFLAGLAVTLAAVVPHAATSAPTVAHNGRWLTDASGRVLILHGVNMVAKLPPYDPAAIGFGEDDAAFLAREGFNTVRLGIIYKALEPERGAYRMDYLESIARTAEMLGRYGMHVVVDFHQDMYNERFNGEGFPDWAVLDDGLPAQPDVGFPGNYFVMPALWRAYDHFWANDPAPDGAGLQDAYAEAWRRVALRLRDVPAVVGYDLFNETWPGTAWPSCANPSGCPLFDATVTAFYRKVIDAIRTVDPHTMVLYETHPIFGGGADVSIGDVEDDNAGFSFHVYCLGAVAGVPSELLGEANCPLGVDRPFERAEAHAERTGDALLLSEFGATDDLASVRRDVEAADRHMMSWQYWSYWNRDVCCERPHEGIVHDLAEPPVGANVKEAKLDVLVRPYPRAVAGTPLAWRFDPELGRFELELNAAPHLGETEIVVPVRHFPAGYDVAIEGGAVVASAEGAPVLRIAATAAGRVVVIVTRR